MGKIQSIGYIKNDATLITQEQCLRDCLENDIGKRGAFVKGKKIIILALDDDNDEYSWSFNQAGMCITEMVALLEIFKKQLIDDYMG